MTRTFEKLFRAPYALPNGLQAVGSRLGPRRLEAPDADTGLWIVDQIIDRVALLRVDQPVDTEYRVPWLIREIATESSNTSGLSYGEGALWLAANGSGARWRTPRPTDARSGEVLRVDPATGKTLGRFPVPGGGGTHGLDYDPYQPGTLWITTLRSQTLTAMRTEDWSVQHTIPLPYTAAHGVVCAEDGIWVVHKLQWAILKLDRRDGAERDRIEVPKDLPEVHCLSAYGDDLIYCDATSGWVVRVGMA